MARPGAWLKAKSPRLHHLLTTRNRPWPILRELVVGVLVLVFLVGALYGLTGQPLKGGYPVVVVTTGSMMHCENGQPVLAKDCDPTHWGRLGAIDPGDIVFVRAVDERSDVDPAAQDGGSTYGGPGDVVVYRKNGSPSETPIIHRALFWVQPNGDGTYDLPDFGLVRASNLPPQALALTNCDIPAESLRNPDTGLYMGPEGAGFVTRGDNNGAADQCGGIMPARLEWVLGKARGEVPWIGLVNLLWGDRGGCQVQMYCKYENAGGDSKVMFFVTVAVLVAAPWLIELGLRRRRRRRQDRDPPKEGAKTVDEGGEGADGADASDASAPGTERAQEPGPDNAPEAQPDQPKRL